MFVMCVCVCVKKRWLNSYSRVSGCTVLYAILFDA